MPLKEWLAHIKKRMEKMISIRRRFVSQFLSAAIGVEAPKTKVRKTGSTVGKQKQTMLWSDNQTIVYSNSQLCPT
ncbi:hypothetical protein CPB84DRAFT_1784628 [Gymnopilus junonius]|uniref:Uncharacterized protein n=1 Tax=Gymnopilus junonius TaxID=109634 RepID=A0A9P5NIV9_GYMJU|nr:hypothetical protein CPB84DRAFT_1784628 [Gymnopilus junonius]